MALPDRGRRHRHPLRDALVEARHVAGAASRSTRCSTGSSPTPTYAMAHSYGGYTTNMPMDDLRDGQAWVAFEFDGEPLDPEHGGPARLLVPHLYFWKSAKWVRGLTLHGRRRARVLGAERLQHARRPLDRRALLVTVGGWRAARVVEVVAATRPRGCCASHVPGWPGNDPGQHVDIRLTAEDGYQAVRSYSLGSYGAGETIELAVDEIPDGEVSPYLVRDVLPGDELEVKGPLGGYFVWRPGGAVARAADRRRVGHRAADGDGAGEDGCRGRRIRSGCCTRCAPPKTRYIAMSCGELAEAGGVDGHVGVHARGAGRMGGAGRTPRRRGARGGGVAAGADADRLRVRPDGVRRARRRRARRARARRPRGSGPNDSEVHDES